MMGCYFLTYPLTMNTQRDYASLQPTGKFTGMYDEVREELELFRQEMVRHKAILNDVGLGDAEDLMVR